MAIRYETGSKYNRDGEFVFGTTSGQPALGQFL